MSLLAVRNDVRVPDAMSRVPEVDLDYFGAVRVSIRCFSGPCKTSGSGWLGNSDVCVSD